MGNILDKIYGAEAELESLNLEIARRTHTLKIMNNPLFEKLVTVLLDEGTTPINLSDNAISNDAKCMEAAELYDMLDWFFMAHGGERIYETNAQFSFALHNGLNAVYDRGQKDLLINLKQL